MTTIDFDIDAIRPLVERYPTATNQYQMDLALRIAEASPDLLAKVDELTNRVSVYAVELADVWEHLTAANRRNDGLQADLNSATKANTAWANENLRLREQVFAQKPVVEAAEAWAEMCEDGGLAPDDCRKSEDALHDAVESYRLMDLALTTARTEAGAAR